MGKQIRKRAMTLLEIMVVIFIIGIISTVFGISLRGSTRKAKDLKTKKAAEKIVNALTTEMELNGLDPRKVAKNPSKYLKSSGMVGDVKGLLKDGDGNDFVVSYTDKLGFQVKSKSQSDEDFEEE